MASKKHLSLGFALVTAGIGLQAAPTPVSGPLAGTGDGLNSKWVQVDFSINPNSLAEAKSVLNLGSGDLGYITTSLFVAPQVDYADGLGYGGVTPDVYEAIPFGPADATFAVRFTGYLNVTTPGDYLFSARHDDGLELVVGGETLIAFPTDTSPTTTTSALVTLAAGLYPIEYTGWEQGGAFIGELSWALGSGAPNVIPQSLLFTDSGIIPEASTWVAAGMTVGMLGLGALRRRWTAR
jgi:hypothetical protein